MAERCSVCQLKDLAATSGCWVQINSWIIERKPERWIVEEVEKTFGIEIGRSTINRHKNHLPSVAKAVLDAFDVADKNDFVAMHNEGVSTLNAIHALYRERVINEAAAGVVPFVSTSTAKSTIKDLETLGEKKQVPKVVSMFPEFFTKLFSDIEEKFVPPSRHLEMREWFEREKLPELVQQEKELEAKSLDTTEGEGEDDIDGR